MNFFLIASLTGNLLMPVHIGNMVCKQLQMGYGIDYSITQALLYYRPEIQRMTLEEARAVGSLAGRSSAEQCPHLWSPYQ